MMKLAKDVYVYSNNQDKELDTNIYIFEYESIAYVYYISGNLSEGGISENISMYPQIEYNLDDKEDKIKYKEMKNIIEKRLMSEKSIKLTKEYIEELVNKREIFSTNIYNNYAIKSISELLNKEPIKKEENSKENEVENDVYDEERPNLKADIKEIDLNDKIEVDIDFGDIQEVPAKIEKEEVKKAKSYSSVDVSDIKEEIISSQELQEMYDESTGNNDNEIDLVDNINDIAEDLESLIFEKPSIKIENKTENENKNIEEGKKEEPELKVKKIDLNKVTNLILQLPKRATKGKDKDTIKIPSYIRDLIPHFFALSESGKNISNEEGIFKVRDIDLEIVDVDSGEKLQDNLAKIVQKQGQTYITIKSSSLEKLNYDENDIARIIKLSDNIYRCEIVSQKSKEYSLWLKMCTQNFKSTERKYGVM